MERALETIEFLSLSANRVGVLQALAEHDRTRGELGEATGASQATIGRILEDFEERSWVEYRDGRYRATATGRLLADGVSDLLSVVETEQRLRPVVSYLPTAELDFGFDRLGDATVTVPTGTRPNAPVGRVLDLVESGQTVRAFSHAFNEQSLGAIAERVTDGPASFEGVFSQSAIEALTEDATLRRRLAALVGAKGATLRIHDGEIPLAVTVVDDVVHLLVRDADGILRASVDTDDPVVHDWAVDRFESYWGAADPLEQGDLSE
jgi:predicted transcriptional regulator